MEVKRTLQLSEDLKFNTYNFEKYFELLFKNFKDNLDYYVMDIEIKRLEDIPSWQSYDKEETNN